MRVVTPVHAYVQAEEMEALRLSQHLRTRKIQKESPSLPLSIHKIDRSCKDDPTQLGPGVGRLSFLAKRRGPV